MGERGQFSWDLSIYNPTYCQEEVESVFGKCQVGLVIRSTCPPTHPSIRPFIHSTTFAEHLLCASHSVGVDWVVVVVTVVASPQTRMGGSEQGVLVAGALRKYLPEEVI